MWCSTRFHNTVGPLLFLIYINDMEMAVKEKLLMYADFSALMVSGKNLEEIEQQLSQQLHSVSEWLVDNKLLLHLGKTESILFGTKHKLKTNSDNNV